MSWKTAWSWIRTFFGASELPPPRQCAWCRKPIDEHAKSALCAECAWGDMVT